MSTPGDPGGVPGARACYFSTPNRNTVCDR